MSTTANAKDPDHYEKTHVHERQHPDFTADDIHMGSFIVVPILKTELEYDSNIFLDERAEVSDFRFITRPSLALRSNFSRHQLNTSIEFERHMYFDETDQNTTGLKLDAGGILNVNKHFDIGTNLSYSRDHEERSDTTTVASAYTPVRFDTKSAGITFAYRPNRLSLNLSANYSNQTFENNERRDTRATLIQEDRDKDILQFSGRASYELSSTLTPYASLSLTQERYDRRGFVNGAGFTGVNRDKTVLSASPGLAFNYKDLLIGYIQLGAARENNKDNALEDKTTYVADSAISWAVSDLTSATLNLNRSFDTDSNVAAGLIETVVDANVYHELRRNFIIGAGAEAKWRDFDNNDRSDTLYSFYLDAEYKVDKHTSIEGRYIINTRSSDAVNLDYSQNIMHVSAKRQF